MCKRTTNRTRAARFATSQRRARRPLIIALLMGGALVLTSVHAAFAATQGPGGQAQADENLVTGVKSPENATINLFDYWIIAEDTPDDNDPSNWRDVGINQGHELRFSDAGRYENPTSNSINAWTGTSGKPYFGIVQPTLGQDGYPVLKAGNIYQSQGGLTTSAQSLAYLFNDASVPGKRTHRDVKGLVQYSNGYYTYDCTKNFAIYNAEQNKFDLYKQPGVKASTGSKTLGQFFPFASENEVFERNASGTLVPKEIDAKNPLMNHYFGLDLTADFTQPASGMVAGKDMKFEFSGDDDVWVFIDGVLVGDLGGVHGAASLSINFKTGEVKLGDARKNPNNTWGGKETTLRACFEEALGKEKAAAYFKEDTNAFLPGSYHTLKFFYLERGNTDSNMKLMFNLQRVTQSTIRKDDQYGAPVPGAQFALYAAERTGEGESVQYTQKGDGLIWQGATNAAGNINIMTPDGKRPYDFAEAHNKNGQDYYILKELSAPEGYRTSPEAWLRYMPSHGDGQDGFLVCENRWDSGVYARPNQVTVVNEKNVVTDVQGTKHKVSDENTLLAIVFKRHPSENDWHPVGGEHGAWKVAQKGMKSVEELNQLMRDGYVHVFSKNDEQWSVDLGDLPGDPTDYPFMTATPQNADYSIGYYLVDMDRTTLEKRIASGRDPITKGNAHFLDSTGAKGNFRRESYATLHVTDTMNGLAVQKLDDAGNPINGVTFQLFRADQMEMVGEGADAKLAPKADALPYMERTTKDMRNVPSIDLDGTAYFERIVKHDAPVADTYYVVEKEVPKGYTGAVDPIRVIVDADGVHADAGVADDDVTVSVGIGSLIDSMNHYGSNDGIEVTLHDVVAQLRVGTVNDSTTPGFYWIGGWDMPAADAVQPDLYLRYNDESTTHEYIPNEDKPKSATRFATDEGFIRAAVKQDAEPCQNHGIGTWENLGSKDITNLFTGSTVIHVTNHRVASLEVEKQVVIPEGLTGPVDYEKLDFTFAFEFKGKDGKPLAGEFDARVFGADGVQRGDDFKIKNGATHTLKHGEVMRVYGLPDGATYTVSEPVEQMPEGFTQTLPLDGAGKPTTATGAIKVGDTSRVLFENAYTPAPAILNTAATLQVKKEFVDAQGEPAWGLEFNAKPAFTFVLDTDKNTPMPEGATLNKDGRLQSTIVIDRGDAQAGYAQSFGAIHYEHPGTYLYALAEKTPDAADRIPGVSYSDAAYRVVVTVSDDKAGKLVADVRLRKLADDAGVPQGDNEAGVPVEPQNGVHTAFFKNVFALNEVQIGPLATKVLNGRGFAIDGSGAGEFTFRMRPAGAHAADAPMPAGTAGDGASRYIEVHNKGSMLSFGQPTFTFEHLNGADNRTGRFDYELFEVIPDDAVNADGVRWDAATADQKLAGGFAKQGMTYDSTRFVARVNLELQEFPLKRAGGKDVLVATITYYRVTALNEQGAWTGFDNDLTPIEHTPGGADRVEFHNTYRAAASTAGIRLTKTLEGRDMEDGEFSFTIEGADEESRKLLAETDKSFSAPAAMSGEKAVMDGKLQLKFDQSHAGLTYTYYIKEVTPLWGGEQIPGLVGGWDNSIYRLEYHVIDNLDGTLKVVPRLYRTYDRSGAIVNIPLDLGAHTDSSGVITLDFVNRYSASTTFAGIEVAKTMYGKDLEAKQFGFTLEPVNSASAQKMLDRGLPADEEQLERIFTAGEAPEGEAHLMEKLKGLKFTQADTGKTYSYRVKENVEPAWDEDGEALGVQADGVTYDSSQFLVSITPADKGDGTMKTVTTVKRTHDALTGDQLAEPELIGTWDSDSPAEGQAEKPRVPFVNRYKARPGALQFDRFTKRLVGRDWSAADSFEFTCEQMSFSSGGHDYKPGDEGFVSVPLVVAPVNAESPQDENGFKLFGISTSPDVLYEQSGRYDYRLREKVPADAVNAEGVRYENATDEQKAAGGFVKDGVVYSNREVRFTVSAFDIGVGDVFVIGPILQDGPQEDGAYFTNKVRRADTALMAKKVLEGRPNPLTEGEFSFVLAPVDGGQPLVSSNDAEGNVRFSDLTFDEPGVYRYTLREVHEAPQANGVTFDDAVYDVVVHVTEAASGELVPAVSVFKDGKPVEGVPVFTNRYDSTVDYSALGGLKITKVLNGRDMTDGQFAFTVKAKGVDAEAVAAAASKLGFAEGQTERVFTSHAAKDGAVDSIDILAGLPGGLVFTQADAGKTFAYEVRESTGGGAGYTNDQTVYGVSISVADDGAGTLTVTTTVTGAAEGEKTYVYTSGQAAEEVEPVVLPFVNSYAAQGDVSIATSKVLHGRPLEAGEFSFELRTGDGAAGSSEVVARAENAADGTVDFGTIEFTLDALADAVNKGYATRDAQGIWHVRYTAVEIVDGLPDGVSATTQSLSFEVSVEDKGDGTLAATVQGLDGHSFENTYVTNGGEPVSIALAGRKVLTYAEGLAPADITGKFTFTVSGEDGAPMPERTEVTNGKDGSVDFGKISFTLDDLNRKWAQEHPEAADLEALADGEATARSGKPRTVSFTYTITESGEVPGVTNDQDASRTVTFTVTDDGSGRLTVTRDPAEGASFTFTNTYTVRELPSSVTDQISISKDLTGKPLAEGDYTFALTELVDDGAGADVQVVTATNDADGRVVFPALTYTEPGVHEYRLAEVVDENAGGIVFDEAVYTVRTTVKDNGDGTLSATHEVLDESGNKVDAVIFANAYDPADVTVSIMAFKTLTGRTLADGEFTFELVDADGTVLQTVSNEARGNVVFTPLRYTAEDLADAAWVDQDGVISRARELVYTVREVVPADAVNADGVRWSDATEQQRATGGFVKDDVVYDGRAFTVTVALSDDGGGALSATASWGEPPVFQNVYDRPVEPGDPGAPHMPGGPVGGEKLPSTGDTSLVLTVGVAIAGVAVAGLGIWLARRKR